MKNFWIEYKGKSMSPLLKEGDRIFIVDEAIENLVPGDVILYLDKLSNEVTLHRLLAAPFTTKGDSALCFDDNLPEQFLGKALGFERKGKFRKFWMNELFCFFSMKRMEHRKFAMLMLIILTRLFELCSEKTNSSHIEEQSQACLSQRAS